MALVAMVEARVTYACKLSKKDEEKVYEYIGDTDMSIEDAVSELCDKGELDLYKHSSESDFCTEYISEVYRKEE